MSRGAAIYHSVKVVLLFQMEKQYALARVAVGITKMPIVNVNHALLRYQTAIPAQMQRFVHSVIVATEYT